MGSFAPSTPEMVNSRTLLSLGVGIVLAQAQAARGQQPGGAVVGFQDDVAQAFFRAVDFAIDVAQLRRGPWRDRCRCCGHRGWRRRRHKGRWLPGRCRRGPASGRFRARLRPKDTFRNRAAPARWPRRSCPDCRWRALRRPARAPSLYPLLRATAPRSCGRARVCARVWRSSSSYCRAYFRARSEVSRALGDQQSADRLYPESARRPVRAPARARRIRRCACRLWPRWRLSPGPARFRCGAGNSDIWRDAFRARG